MSTGRRRLFDGGWCLFLLLMAVYLLSYSGSFHAIDEVSAAATVESLVKQGRVSTDQIWWSLDWTPSQGQVGPDEHLYSKKGVGSALLGAPFYWLALHLPGVGAVRALMLANSLVTALTGWLVYACAVRLGYSPRAGAIAALGYGLGTMAWPYARYFFSEPLAALGLMAALWGWLVVRQTGRAIYAVVAGAGLGLALLAKVTNGAAWPLFLAYAGWTVPHERPAGERLPTLKLFTLAVGLPLLVALGGLVLYNTARSGQPLDMGYAPDETFSTPLVQGLAGLLLSPGKSLFLYCPLLLAALFGIVPLMQRDRATALLSLGIVVLYPAVYAGWFMWWGGWSWGPRFLVPMLPFFCLFLAPVADQVIDSRRRWPRIALLALGLVSVGVQVLGVATDFNHYLGLLYERGIDSAEANWHAALSPLLGHLALLWQGPWDLAWARDRVGGVDWPRLAWPLALLGVACVGGWLIRRTQRVGRCLWGAAGVTLLAISALALARLPAPDDDWQAGSEALSVAMQAAGPADVLMVDLLPYASHLDRATTLLERYKAPVAYYGWARQEPVTAAREALLGRLSHKYRQIWLALDTTPEGDPASTTERWLDENAYRVESHWLGSAVRLVRYVTRSAGPDLTPAVQLDLKLGSRIRLAGLSPAGPLSARAGEVVSLTLFWQADRQVKKDYQVFIQLLDDAGRLWAQVDRPPVGGFRPTSSWQPGETVSDNYGLALPSDLPPGRYRLIGGLYLPTDMKRLEVSAGDGTVGRDYALLAEVVVSGEAAP